MLQSQIVDSACFLILLAIVLIALVNITYMVFGSGKAPPGGIGRD